MRVQLLKKAVFIFVACLVAMLAFITVAAKADQLLKPDSGILTSCDFVRGRLCVMSLGQIEGETFVGLRSTEQFTNGLKLYVNQELFSCELSSFDAEFIYCTGPLLQDYSSVNVDAFAHDGSLIGSGVLTVNINVEEQGNDQPMDLYPPPYYVFMSIVYKMFPKSANP